MSKLRYRNADERALIRWAAERGWRRIGRNGCNHMQMEHVSGVVTQIPGKLPNPDRRRAAMRQLDRALEAPTPTAAEDVS